MPASPGRLDFDAHDLPKVDKRDLTLIAALAEHAREPFNKLGERIFLSPDSAAYRLKRLQAEKVILKCFAQVDFCALGWEYFHLFLLIDEEQPEERTQLLTFLRKHPNVLSVVEYTDRWDLEVVMIARSVRQFDRLSQELAGKFPEFILEKDQMQVVRLYHNTHYPHEMAIPEVQETADKALALSKTDVQLLVLLNQDARQSTYELSRATGMSPDACGEHMRSLEKRKIIEQYTILPSLSKLGISWYTFFMSVKTFEVKHESALLEFLRQHPQIIRVAKTIGDTDLIFSIAVKNPVEYHMLVKQIKGTFASIVKSYDTMAAFHEHVHKTFPEIIAKEEQ